MMSIAAFNVDEIRQDFPILQQKIHQKPLVYLDNAATSQKPFAVINAIKNYYEQDNANIHRGVHTLSERATLQYEQARKKVQKFINAGDSKEIIFLRGTTEAINLVAQSYGRNQLKAGDIVLISEMEHHSNIVPWQMLCEQNQCQLSVIPILDNGELDVEKFYQLLNDKVKLMAITHVSNALGSINPVREMIQAAKVYGITVLLDGAQAAPHMKIDVQDLNCDFPGQTEFG
jgi:cysteine desulfurase / selenocysteine lyase